MRILNIIENAYRGTLEEQDDTILWLSGALRNSGADLTVLLRGSAVNYVVRQDCPPLAIGESGIPHPAKPLDDLRRLHDAGVPVYVLEDDLETRGLARDRADGVVSFIRSGDIASLLDSHDQVWHW